MPTISPIISAWLRCIMMFCFKSASRCFCSLLSLRDAASINADISPRDKRQKPMMSVYPMSRYTSNASYRDSVIVSGGLRSDCFFTRCFPSPRSPSVLSEKNRSPGRVEYRYQNRVIPCFRRSQHSGHRFRTHPASSCRDGTVSSLHR